MIRNSIAQKENSFFDEYSKTEVYNALWVSNEHVVNISTENKKIISSGNFKKKGKLLKAWTTRFYAINEEKILFYKKTEKSPKPKKVCFLPHTRLSFISAGSNPAIPAKFMGFSFTRYGKVFEMFTEDQNEFSEWKRILSPICVLHHFHNYFEVDKMIGKGSFARVYLSKHKISGDTFAIKAFSKDFVLNQHKGRENLLNEIQLLRDVHHPQIVKLLETYESPNSVFLVLEMLKGGELFTRIAEKKDYTEHDVKVILKKLISALSYLHDKKIMHRDLKPENLLLKDEAHITNLILADFGLATYLDGSEIIFKRCGTPGFVAPEILLYTEDSKMYNEKCDMYSAGVIFYMLLTGQQPFFGEDFNEILRLNKLGIIDYTVKELGRWSPNAIDLLQKMLDFNPATRLSSSDALHHKFLENIDISHENTQPESPTSSVLSLKNNLRTLNKKNRNDNELGSLEHIVKDENHPLQTTKIPVYGNDRDSNHSDHGSLGALDSPIKRNIGAKKQQNEPEESKLENELEDLNVDEDNKKKGLMKPMDESEEYRVQMAKTSIFKKKSNASLF